MHPQYIALWGLLGLVLFCGASSNAQPVEQDASRFVGISPANLMFIKDTYYYIETSAPKNWFNALSACQKIGYELLSLQTTEKYNLVINFLISSRQPLYFWTSGNDLYSLGSHHWYPGNETILDSLWAAKQPDNVGGVEHCDALWKNRNTYTLRDYNCNLAKNYICEVPFPSATTSTESSSTQSSSTESSTQYSSTESSTQSSSPESSSTESSTQSSSTESSTQSSSPEPSSTESSTPSSSTESSTQSSTESSTQSSSTDSTTTAQPTSTSTKSP